jgi:hypothetical protein
MHLASGRLYPYRMKRTVSLFLSTLFFVFLFFRTTEAHALGPINIEAGALAGYATNPNSDNGYNTLGVGLGARGGVEFLGIYGGLRAMYYFGGSNDIPGGGSISSHAFMYGIDGGYSFHLLMLTIRPQIGIGNLTLAGSEQANSAAANLSVSNSNLYLQPGVTGLLTFGVVYVGAEVNVLIIPGVDQGDGNSKTYASLAINGEVGVRF